MSLTRRGEPLQRLMERLKVNSLRSETAKPGVNEALRVSQHFYDGRQPDTVATLRRGHSSQCALTVIYEKPEKLLQYDLTVPLERYQKLLAALRLNKFDTLDDEPDLPHLGVDLWLIERASGSFYHDVVLSPGSAKGHHRELVIAVRNLLSEAVRELAG